MPLSWVPVVLVFVLHSVLLKLVSTLPVLQSFSLPDHTLSLPKVVSMLLSVT
jgi:hypothetical protein